MRKTIINKHIFFLLLIAFFPACNSWLDVSPKSQIKEGDLFATEEGFKKQLAGVYSALVSESLYGKEMTFGLVDVLAQVWSNSEGERYKDAKEYNYEEAVTKSRIDGIWNNMYNAIANANILLNNIDGKKDIFTGNNYSIIKGEALALRAFMHFDLLRLFGTSFYVDPSRKCIPYVSIYGKALSPQLSVAQVADSILADLQKARALLSKDPIYTGQAITEDYDNGYLMNRQVQLNYYAVTGLIARVYTYRGEIDKAIPYAQEVIDSGKFPWVQQDNLTPPLEKRDLVFASEHLFSLNVVTLATLSDKYFKIQYGAYYFSFTPHVTEYFPQATDYRSAYLLVSSEAQMLYAKYWQSSEQQTYFRNKMPLIRISEMYLILAEAYKISDPVKAAGYIDALSQARGLGQVSTGVGFDLDAILFAEYRREFLGEGQLFYYYKRFNQANIPHQVVNPLEKNAYVLPLPDVEIEFGHREPNR